MGGPTERRARHGAREGQGREASQEDGAEVDQGEARGEEGQEVHGTARVARVRGPAPAWGGEEVVVRFDEPCATWMFVCVHSTVLGPGAGGTRMKVYAEPRDALRDGLRLSSAMTSQNAIAA